ncbi:hypothetical protein V502_06498, partial [Pseudogymnoascus sp. VKM F-4520 (FW-2644)]
WISYACGTCPACATGADGVCFNQKISGYYTPGTFQQYVLAPSTYVTPIPAALKSEDAAPLLCAGLTSYAALRKSGAQSGQFVVISGAGGGLGHLAIQIGARGMGLRMIGIDHGSKEALVKESGAEAFFDVTKFDDAALAAEVKKVTGGLGAHAYCGVGGGESEGGGGGVGVGGEGAGVDAFEGGEVGEVDGGV